jgi:hypothetical protein
MWNLGCDFAISMVGSNQSVVVSILHFGQPWKEGDEYGVKTHAFGFPFATNAEVVTAAVNFADGYGLCHDLFYSHTALILGIGVNNYGPYVDYENGNIWGQVVSDIETGLDGTFGEHTVLPVGAADMELSFNDEISTTDWFFGYFAGPGDYLYNFGAAEGCPAEDVPGTYDGQCGTPDYPNWRQSDVWFITSGFYGARAFPQIYATDGYNADQWYQIALYGYRTYQLFPFVARGALTQFAACEQRPGEDGCQPGNPYLKNTPQQGWEQFYNALRRDPRTLQDLPYSSDIEYQGE